MQLWLKDIKGMWVATYTEGRMMGAVNSIYLDVQKKTVDGFVLRSGTPLAGEDHWVEIKDIKKIGIDLIFLPNESVVSKGEPRGRRLSQLLGMPVSSKDGRALGTLADIQVNCETWQITNLGLPAGQSVPIDLKETVLGDDIILVQAGAAGEERVDEKKRENIIQSVFGREFLKQTSEAFKKVLKGGEAKLPQPEEVIPASESEPKPEPKVAAPDTSTRQNKKTDPKGPQE